MHARGVAGPDLDGHVAEMLRDDRASSLLGIRVDHARDGTATAVMTVRDDMVNGLDVCHGGFIFTLADTAMAAASNSRSRAFATNAEIDFVEPARRADELTAVAHSTVSRGRSAIWDVVISNQRDETIAVFRGRTLAVPAPRPGPTSVDQ